MNRREEEILRKGLAISRLNETLVSLPRVCSRHGQPYVAVYRLDNGFWRFKECRRLEGTGAGVAQSIEIDDAKMTGTEEERCPWCGQGTKIVGGVEVIYCQCYRCRQYVCLGASTDKEFRCCPQCGNRSTRMSEIEEKTRIGSLLPKPLSLAAGHVKQLAATSRASLPAPARLQLPNGRR
jgi:hypothetical protein